MADNGPFGYSIVNGECPTLSAMGPEFTFIAHIYFRSSYSRDDCLVQLFLYRGQVVVAKTALLSELEQEVDFHRRIGNHANIIQLRGFLEDVPQKGLNTVFIEYANGGSLAELRKAADCERPHAEALTRPGGPESYGLPQTLPASNVLPGELMWHILLSVLDGIMHIRSKGLMHYDLHDANILLLPYPDNVGRFPQVKIIDFGVMEGADLLQWGYDKDVMDIAEELTKHYPPYLSDEMTEFIDEVNSRKSLEKALAAHPDVRKKARQVEPLPRWLQDYFRVKMDTHIEAIEAAREVAPPPPPRRRNTLTKLWHWIRK